VTNNAGTPLSNQTVTLVAEDDGYTQTLQTDGNGSITFDLLDVRHFKYGNSQEHGGITGVPTRTDYQHYRFILAGHQPYIIPIAQLKNVTSIAIP
jgi:hypothetical protein